MNVHSMQCCLPNVDLPHHEKTPKKLKIVQILKKFFGEQDELQEPYGINKSSCSIDMME